MMLIIGFLKLSSIGASGVPKQSEEDILKELDQDDKCFYTGDCKITGDIAAVGTDSDREYRTVEEKYFMMFETLSSRHEPYKHACEEEGKKVIDLQYLYDNGRAVKDGKAHLSKGKSPGKWMDWVIFYSLENRSRIMGTDDFLGIVIYSEFYKVCGKHRETLLDNLFELYIIKKGIKKGILDNPEGFYDSIYAINGNREDLRDKRALAFLERVMKEMLLRVLKTLKLPIGTDSEGINLTIYERVPVRLDSFYSKRDDNRLVPGDDIQCENVTFRNVIMERAPSSRVSDDYKKILLTLIGTIRSGKSIMPVGCMYWLDNYDFSKFLRVVNPNGNLLGITGLNGSMDLESMFGSIKSQLGRLDIEFGPAVSAYPKAVEFLNSLNGIELRISLFYGHSGGNIMERLLAGQGVKCVSSLRILDVENCLTNGYIMRSLKAVASDPKTTGLEFCSSKVSLEGLLSSPDFGALKNKLRVLEVSGIGSIGEKIANADLKSLKLERLQIEMRDNDKDVIDLDQLVRRGIIMRDGFKYLVFRDIDNPENRKRIVDLRHKLGERKWPVIVTNFDPPGTENKDFTRICNEYYFELLYR